MFWLQRVALNFQYSSGQASLNYAICSIRLNLFEKENFYFMFW